MGPACYCSITPQSGLASKTFIDVEVKVIDVDYHGNLGIVSSNLGCEDFEIKM